MATYRRARSTRLLVIALLLTSLVTITVDSRGGQSGPLAAMGRIGLAIVTPLQEGVSSVFRPVGSFFSNVFRAGSIAAENERLKAQLAEVRRAVQNVLEYQRQNEEFRRVLGLAEELDFQGFGATVIGLGVSNFEWTIEIDKGSGDGVYVDMPVVNGSGLVGRVVQVAPSSAQVMLIIDPDSQVAVRLASTGERGSLAGQREEDLRMELVSPDVEVGPGEPVVTSGYRLPSGVESGLYPPEIPVGEVSLVEADPANLETVVFVRPYVDFSRLDYVMLIEGIEPPPESGRP